MTELVRDTEWYKSSFSSADSDNCVEVRMLDGVVGVRDSKAGGAPGIWFERAAWSAFIAGMDVATGRNERLVITLEELMHDSTREPAWSRRCRGTQPLSAR